MDILKLKPYYSEKIWGYEKWNLSTHKNGSSIIEENNVSLDEYLKNQLPILIKIIKSNESLSVQVHPDDEFSRKYENDNGKTECWYVLEADKEAQLICGLKKGLNKEGLSKVLEDGKIEDYLDRIDIKAGDMIYIPSGTVHAIGGGIKLVEIQQSSDVTYRLYDWGRDRETHIDKSLEVIDYEGKNNAGKIEDFKKLNTPYFNVEKIVVDGEYCDKVNSDFHSYTVINGHGSIVSPQKCIEINEEDTVYVEKDTDYVIKGNLELLKSY